MSQKENLIEETTIKNDLKPLLILAGPTAVGKTAASIHLAKALHGEIISGDSMQIFKGLDIGTAKITKEEMQGIPHHMIDIKEPWETFSVAEFKQRVDFAIAEIHAKGKLPILVGGTGFYINSVLYDYHFGEANVDLAYRAALEEYLAQYGNEALWQMLHEKDAASAERLHSNDVKRVMRALEVLHVTGKPASERTQTVDRTVMRYNAVYIALQLPRDVLYARINQRVEQMIQAGLEQEVQAALASGVPQNALSMTSLGYRQMIQYLNGEISLPRAIELIQRDTRHFAKRQLTWFRHDPNIQWVDKQDKTEEAVADEILKIVQDRFGQMQDRMN